MARAVVGGADYAVGGWGEYEACRRQARWEATGGAQTHYRQAQVSAEDAALSLARPAIAVLQKAAQRAAAALTRREAALEAGPQGLAVATLPPLTAADLYRATEDVTAAGLRDLAAGLEETAAAIGVSAALPRARHARRARLPARGAPAADARAVLALEKAVLPYVAEVETLIAGLAAGLDALGAALEH